MSIGCEVPLDEKMVLPRRAASRGIVSARPRAAWRAGRGRRRVRVAQARRRGADDDAATAHGGRSTTWAEPPLASTISGGETVQSAQPRYTRVSAGADDRPRLLDTPRSPLRRTRSSHPVDALAAWSASAGATSSSRAEIDDIALPRQRLHQGGRAAHRPHHPPGTTAAAPSRRWWLADQDQLGSPRAAGAPSACSSREERGCAQARRSIRDRLGAAAPPTSPPRRLLGLPVGLASLHRPLANSASPRGSSMPGPRRAWPWPDALHRRELRARAIWPASGPAPPFRPADERLARGAPTGASRCSSRASSPRPEDRRGAWMTPQVLGLARAAVGLVDSLASAGSPAAPASACRTDRGGGGLLPTCVGPARPTAPAPICSAPRR